MLQDLDPTIKAIRQGNNNASNKMKGAYKEHRKIRLSASLKIPETMNKIYLNHSEKVIQNEILKEREKTILENNFMI